MEKKQESGFEGGCIWEYYRRKVDFLWNLFQGWSGGSAWAVGVSQYPFKRTPDKDLDFYTLYRDRIEIRKEAGAPFLNAISPPPSGGPKRRPEIAFP